MIRALASLGGALLALAACGDDKPPSPPPAPATIADPLSYLAQSRACDGNAATPLRAADPIRCRRFDFGRHQASESFLTADGAITAWSYAPHGPFSIAPDGYGAHGDGGEQYVLRGDAVQITHTQDGGKPGVQQFFVPWTVLTTRTGACPHWTIYNPLERGCRSTVDYPKIGPVDTVVSEHGDSNATERIFLGKGHGRIVWQAFSAAREPPADLAARCPDFGWQNPPKPGQRLVDCRIAVNIEPADGALSGAQLWSPGR